jgi:predicted phosphodiesterase
MATVRTFAVSDIHVDYDINKRWITHLPEIEYRNDLLILAGDVAHSLKLLEWCLTALVRRFKKVLYVPGNHELWVVPEDPARSSLDKFDHVCRVAESCGVSMQPFHVDRLSIIPLLGWYDYSFGEPDRELFATWMDYHACRWPDHWTMRDIARHFACLNEPWLGVSNHTIISFSHFLPRIDIMPSYVPEKRRVLYPVLGSCLLGAQIRRIGPKIHVYGHSHVNRRVTVDGVSYINNAFGYPQETRIAAKALMCIHEG